MRKELLEGLTEEQIAKVRACKNQEDFLRVAKEEGIELTGEQLEAVSGGACSDVTCPNCGTVGKYGADSNLVPGYCMCPKCGKVPLPSLV